MQALRSAKNTCQCLNGDANNIIQWLLNRQRNSCSLRVETHLQRTLVLRAEALLHLPSPEATRGAVLRDLFKEVVVSIEEKRNPRHKPIEIQSRLYAPLHILDTIAQCERQLLDRRCPSFTYVIAAD